MRPDSPLRDLPPHMRADFRLAGIVLWLLVAILGGVLFGGLIGSVMDVLRELGVAQ